MDQAIYTVADRTATPEFCVPALPPVSANIAVMRRSDGFEMAPEAKVDFSEYLHSDSASNSPIVGFSQTIEGFCHPRPQGECHSGLPGLGHTFSASAQFHGRGAYGSAYAQAGSYHSHSHFSGASSYQTRSITHFEVSNLSKAARLFSRPLTCQE